jgi:hypothetical protein
VDNVTDTGKERLLVQERERAQELSERERARLHMSLGIFAPGFGTQEHGQGRAVSRLPARARPRILAASAARASRHTHDTFRRRVRRRSVQLELKSAFPPPDPPRGPLPERSNSRSSHLRVSVQTRTTVMPVTVMVTATCPSQVEVATIRTFQTRDADP